MKKGEKMNLYITKKRIKEKIYTFDVYGSSFEDAQLNADILDLGKVSGQLIATYCEECLREIPHDLNTFCPHCSADHRNPDLLDKPSKI